MKKRYFAILLLMLAVIIGSAATSVLVVRTNQPPRFGESDKLDQWLHEQLRLRPEQVTAMAPSEKEFHKREQEIVQEIHALNQELAQAMMADRENSPRVQSIRANIHEAQGRLQELTMSHIFEMREFLDEGQYNELLKHASDALTSPRTIRH